MTVPPGPILVTCDPIFNFKNIRPDRSLFFHSCLFIFYKIACRVFKTTKNKGFLFSKAIPMLYFFVLFLLSLVKK